jgi:RNA polymerase sigma factor (sigma-70 family)
MPTRYSSSASPIGVSGDLLTAALQGQEDAWVPLFNRFSNAIQAVARSCRLNAYDADDVVQTTWLRLIENAHRIRNPQALGAWLAITARRECLRLIRISARERATDPTELPDDAMTPAVAAHVLDRERNEVLRRAVEGLPSHQRVLLHVLTADPPPSYEQISAALRVPVGSIGPTRGRALASLRRDSHLMAAIGD